MPTEGQIRRTQWTGLIAGILMLPVLLGVLYLINPTVERITLLFVVTDLFFVGFLVGDVNVIVGTARKLGLIGTRRKD
jgi:hypothetical protein